MAEEKVVAHKWPTDNDHLFGEWMVKDKNHFYRKCVHPMCPKIEEKQSGG